MGRLTRYTARRVAAVGGLLVLALIAGAAPAVAAQPPRPDCVGSADRRAPVSRLLAALGVAVFDVQIAGRSVAAACPPKARVSTGHATSAAALQNWGEPTRVEEFDGTRLGPRGVCTTAPGTRGRGGAPRRRSASATES